MDITRLGRAAILIRCGDITLLCNPERAALELLDAPPNYIYLSHRSLSILSVLDLRSCLLVSRCCGLASTAHELGFRTFALSDYEALTLESGLAVRILATADNDSVLAIDDGAKVFINLNDSLLAADARMQSKFLRLLRALYPHIDYLACEADPAQWSMLAATLRPESCLAFPQTPQAARTPVQAGAAGIHLS